MARFHNKKRNVGIIYEQIIKFMCKSLLDKNDIDAKKASKIIKKRFAEGTQLHKEYKLFKALTNTKGISESFATSIINEAKKACNNHFNEEILEREKSELIKELNFSFGKDKIFNQSVKLYKDYATIQVLINEWRTNRNFDISTDYEIKLHKMLTEEVVEKKDSKYKNINSLTFKLMKEIFDKKYKNTLNENQKNILYNFVNEDNEKLKTNLKIIKEETLKELENYKKYCNNNVLLEKYNAISEKVKSLDEENISRESLKKFLIVEKLREEIVSKDK